MNFKLKTNFMNLQNKDELIPNTVVISAFRRYKNLKDWLVRAELSTFNWEKPLKGQSSQKMNFMRNNMNNTIFKIKQHLTLRSKNCI